MTIVLDTNVLAAGLLSPFGVGGEIVRMVSSGELILSLDARILSEYAEVLHRPKFKFEKEKVAALLDYIVHRGQTTAPSPLSNPLPDSDDEAFLEVAITGQAACLITGKKIHFPAELCRKVKVLSPKEFLIFYKKQKHSKTERIPMTRKNPRAR